MPAQEPTSAKLAKILNEDPLTMDRSWIATLAELPSNELSKILGFAAVSFSQKSENEFDLEITNFDDDTRGDAIFEFDGNHGIPLAFVYEDKYHASTGYRFYVGPSNPINSIEDLKIALHTPIFSSQWERG